MPPRARLLARKVIYSGKIVQLSLDRVIEPGGVKTIREVVHHRGSVVVVPHLPDGRIILVRQFRHATGKSLWELVAGGMERGEKPRGAARRELLEETGYRARRLNPVLSFYASPGFLTEEMYLVEAWGLEQSKAQPESDERIEIGRFHRNELIRMLRARKIRDAKTLVGLLWNFGLRRIKV